MPTDFLHLVFWIEAFPLLEQCSFFQYHNEERVIDCWLRDDHRQWSQLCNVRYTSLHNCYAISSLHFPLRQCNCPTSIYFTLSFIAPLPLVCSTLARVLLSYCPYTISLARCTCHTALVLSHLPIVLATNYWLLTALAPFYIIVNNVVRTEGVKKWNSNSLLFYSQM